MILRNVRRAVRAVEQFLFRPSSPIPLAALRIAIASVLLLQAWQLAPELQAFFGRQGIIATALTDLFIKDQYMPRVQLLTDWLGSHLGWNEHSGLAACGAVYVLSLLCILAGFRARTAAAVACFFHAILLTTGYYTAYGVDRFTQICLFYFIFMPTSDVLSVEHPRLHAPASEAATLSLRVFQLHLCVAYAASGLEKVVGVQWRDGEAVFRAMMLPSFNQFDVSWLARAPWLGKLLCWGTLVLEMGYPVFIWPRRLRRLWIAGVESLHVGIGVFMGLYFFAAVMGLLTLCAFGLPTLLERRERES
jgi:uncharacterized membrane protein YphA (DoxX/SURF4 family)